MMWLRWTARHPRSSLSGRTSRQQMRENATTASELRRVLAMEVELALGEMALIAERWSLVHHSQKMGVCPLAHRSGRCWATG